MDPVTATTSLITLVSFIKELVELGHGIATSIEKVNENRRQIRNLVNDILHTLTELAKLIREREEHFQTPALLAAIGNLKADMIHALEICRRISPVERKSGLRGIKTQLKGWIKRDEIEGEIQRLKEHVNKCFLMFVTFSTTRIEKNTAEIIQTTERTRNVALRGMDATLRVEQRFIVDTVESQVKLRKLETMMSRVLLETSFGQNVMEQTIQVILSDPGHRTLEAQYLSTQTLRLIPLVQQIASGGVSVLDASLWMSQLGLKKMEGASAEHVLHSILSAVVQITNPNMDMEIMNNCIVRLGTRLRSLGMATESIAWELFTCQILHRLANEQNSFVVMPRLARALRRLSLAYRDQMKYQEALKASEHSLELWRSIFETNPSSENQIPFLNSITVHMENLASLNRRDELLPLAEESVAIARADLMRTRDYYKSDGKEWSEEDKYAARRSFAAIFRYAHTLAWAQRSGEACSVAIEAFELLTTIPLDISHLVQVGSAIDMLMDQISIVGERGGFTFEWLARPLILFHHLAQQYAEEFSTPFLRLLHAYTYMGSLDVNPNNTSHNLRVFLEPSGDNLPPLLPAFQHQVYHKIASAVVGAVLSFYIRPADSVYSLVLNLFLAHPQSALIAFSQVVDRSLSVLSPDPQIDDWVVHTLAELLNSNGIFTQAERIKLLGWLQRLWAVKGQQLADFCSVCILRSCSCLWLGGLTIETMNVLEVCANSRDQHVVNTAGVMKAAILGDMGRIDDAMAVMVDLEHRLTFHQRVLPAVLKADEDHFYQYCFLRIQFLRRTTRREEAIAFIHDVLTHPVVPPSWSDDGLNDMHYILILVERLELRLEMGQPKAAFDEGENIVKMCRGGVNDVENEYRLFSLARTLVAVSECLTRVGRISEAILACREALSIYKAYESQMWHSFLLPSRKEKLGGMAYQTLSRQLLLAGSVDEGLVHAHAAVDIYRKLVELVPRHRPALAEALQNLARTSQIHNHPQKCLEACEEAITILLEVVSNEAYLLPMLVAALDQLETYPGHNQEWLVAMRSEATAIGFVAHNSTVPRTLFTPVRLLRLDSDGDDSLSNSINLNWRTLVEDGDLDGIPKQQNITLTANLDSSPTKTSHRGQKLQSFLPLDLDKVELAPLKTALYTPMEIHLRLTPIDAFWWAIVVMLSMLVAVLGVVILAQDGRNE
ncbi:Tetratricopeptide repeat family [Mycena indigotica]|uniref:Tetratricopeptide repeat family n=1 Tax=Mycena indigotica TaxID=2126181 RepID=A0A8H6TFW2_9AGAR|nr:Tetratricopeptide repeat family [Mycena indigotica]KAF7315957.1 Tetratricopeptide repeat family [Mycena indigotica]